MGYNKKFQIKFLNIKGAKVSYSTSNKKIATVSKKGLVVSKKKKGKCKIIINYTKGKSQVQYILNVETQKKVPKNYSLIKYKTTYKEPTICLYKHIPIKKSFTIKLKNLTPDAKLTFKSSNKKIVTVSKKGKITPHKVGRADVTATIVEDGITYKYFFVCRVSKDGVESNTSYLKVVK